MRFILFWLAAAVAPAQPSLVIENAASFRSGSFAPGSLIRVENGLASGALSLSIQPAASSSAFAVSFVQGSIALLPANLPLGAATIMVSSDGQALATIPISIAASSFGLFTQASGFGPVLAQNSLTKPAKPGDYLTLWGTGLGSATQHDVSVLLGGHNARVTYAGSAPGFPGTDQINFQMPDDPAVPFGCYVAISVTVSGSLSNTGMLSTSSDGSPCKNPFGFTTEQMTQLDAGQSLPVGQVNLYDMVGPPLSEWFTATGFTRMESAQALFMNLNGPNVAQLLEPLRADDAYYSCEASTNLLPGLIGSSGSVDAGTPIALSSGSKSLLLQAASYQTQLPSPAAVTSPDAVPAPFFSTGVWTATFPSGSQGHLSVPAPVRLTNAAALASIDHTQPLTIHWNGGDYTADYTAILQLNGSQVVLCRTPADAGSLIVPSALLQDLTPQNGSLELLLMPRPDRLTAFSVSTSTGSTIPTLFRYFPSEVVPVTIH